MSLEDLGNIGELVAAVGVIASLIYLALQIRQNTKAVRRSSHQSAVEGFTNVNSILLQDSEATQIVTTGLQHPEELDANELTRFERWVGSLLAHMENLFFQHRDGIIEIERWEAYEAVLREFAVTRGYSVYWKRCRHRYSSSFQEFVEQLRAS